MKNEEHVKVGNGDSTSSNSSTSKDKFPFVFYVLPRTRCMHCGHSVK